MKVNVKRTVVILFLSAAVACCFIIPTADKAAAASSSAAGPADIFLANCAQCHGRDGRAQTAKGKRAGATDLTSDWNRDEARGIRIITNGKGQMPSFKKKLTAAEIRAVFGYVSRF